MKAMDPSSKLITNCKGTHYSAQLIFEPGGKQMLNGLTVALSNPNVSIPTQEIKEEKEDTQSDTVLDLEIKPAISDCMICNCCQAHFVDREEQLGHYKCDWHRYNLHRRLKGLPCVSEEEFDEAAGDVSSISGSDEDDAVDGIIRFENDTPIAEIPTPEESSTLTERKYYKVFFKTKEGELISLLRCLLHHKKSPLYEHESILAAVGELLERKKWIILMVAAGHFAGSVFNGNEVVDHKTFHRYTVRAKRGTSQSAMDSHGGATKSAGANLRRYNEAALVLDVQDLLSRWEEHIESCHLVFIRVPMANRVMFFGGKNPAFKKDDPRIREIPFNTRRPTFNETKRVHKMLSSVQCYGKAAELSDFIPLSPPRMFNSETSHLTVRGGSPAPKPSRAMNKKQHAQQSGVLDTAKDSDATAEDQDKEIEMDLVETLEVVDFSELKQFDNTVKKRHKRRKLPSTDKQNLTRANCLGKEMVELRNTLFTACKIGCLESVQTFLDKFGNEQSHIAMSCLKDTCQEDTRTQNSQNSVDNSCMNEVSGGELELSVSDSLRKDHSILQTADTDASSDHRNSQESSMATTDSGKIPPNTLTIAKFLNMPLRDDGTTFLHIASKEGHAEVVTTLLTSGADPAEKNREGKTPYNLGETEVRNAFRRFMAQFPDRYDYVKAQISSPLTAEMEAEKKQKATEKRKSKKKAINEQRKDKKAAEEKIRQENQEKDRFTALSDREKRALAAERRIMQQYNNQGVSQPVLSRCWQCGTDITGKVPFEYSDYTFCTTKCLREHRSKSSTSK